MADRGGYIGRNPADSSVIVARQTFEPTGVQTDFTFSSGYDPGYLDVYLNGSRLVVASDYTATDGNTVGLTSFASNGDVLECVAYKAFSLGSIDSAAGNFTVGGDLTVIGDITGGISTVSYATTSFGLEGTPTITVTDVNATGTVHAQSFLTNGNNSPTKISSPLVTPGVYDTVIENSTNGDLFIKSAELQLKANHTGVEKTWFHGHPDYSVDLYCDGNIVLQTITSGVVVTGVCSATSFKGDGSGLSGVGGETDITSCLFI